MTLEAGNVLDVTSADDRPTLKAPMESFTGEVFLDELVKAGGASRLNATIVTFTPGARTAWHSHGFRQVLFAAAGHGCVQVKGEAAYRLRPGDVAVIPRGLEHWHGASPNSLFTHIALLESDGPGTTWNEPVSDNEYVAACNEQDGPRFGAIAAVNR